ncbi:MAG TPA: ABC transporter substrate-binding protein [Candidatus Limnocylindrales bacterium]|nr:ABC transporter substrate-binding protein [Candidatus Limnocylindrales bacterium]
MIDRTTKLRWRRKLRNSRRQVEDIGVQAEEQLDQHLFRRLARLADVRRFVTAWVLLFVLLGAAVALQTRALAGYYQVLQPAPGGTYAEGMVGSFTNANPLYATGQVDSTASRLIFAGLLKYDSNNKLVGDLAEKWSVDDTGKTYTVKLKPELKWHDGKPLTADDVVFTFQTIQNPDAGSPLFASWRGITVKAADPQTVTFRLTNTFAPFIYSLTTGIVPKHSLENVEPAQLRSSLFNTARPVGAGPFKWATLESVGNSLESREQHIGLQAFDDYHAGAPALKQFIIKTYADEAHLLASFEKQEVNALVGLDKTPDNLLNARDIQEFNVSLTAENMVFFKTDSDVVKDYRVRQALVQAVNVGDIVSGLGYPVIKADEPLLRGQIGYNPDLRQLVTNPEQSKKLLDEAGWKLSGSGQVRSNGTKKLEIKLVAQNTADNIYLTRQLQKTWGQIGVSVVPTLLEDEEIQAAVKDRAYDALVYGISLGTDPDMFAYWHSTQSDPIAPNRLNLSDYKSTVTDKALEAGRNRLDPELRSAKYVPFLQAWRNDAPALALYQPRFLYIVRGQLTGFAPKAINSGADRFANIENWMIRQEHTVKAE